MLFHYIKDNRGDMNVSKMTHVAIVFVVGAILLIMLTSSFQGPIKAWLEDTVADWFHRNTIQSGWKYNGVHLPAFPEDVDMGEFQYYGIAYMEGYDTYSIAFLDAPIVTADTNSRRWVANGNATMIQYVLSADGQSWEYVHTTTMSAGSTFVGFDSAHFAFANFNINDQNGHTYLPEGQLQPDYAPLS